MNAEIISIGTEITTGSTLNTNVQYISERLLELGIETLYHTSVDDNIDRLKEVIEIALNRVDFIITTGGLGPTDDDLTREVFSEALDLRLIEDPTMLEIIKDKFNSYNKTQVMPSNNLKQAVKLEGSQFLANSVGTAPGILVNKNNKKIIMLPGPPGEMKTMFQHEVKPLIHEELHIVKKSVNLSGIGESFIEMEIKDLLNKQDNINIATFAKVGEVEIKIIGKGKNKAVIEKDINNIVKILEHRFQRYIYGFDNVPIEVIVFEMLKKKNYKIGLCESCTGGLISGRFSRIPGVSYVLDRSIVTYSNNSKIEEVQVKNETLKQFGAVSKEVALEMATGMLLHGDLDLTLSVTGIAGPASKSDTKPVGLVYICIATKDNSNVIELNLTGSRNAIQDKTVTRAFLELRNYLLKYQIKD